MGNSKSVSRSEAASRAAFAAYSDLRKQFENPSGSCVEELQATTEYLLDKLKEARKHGLRLLSPQSLPCFPPNDSKSLARSR